MSFIASIILKDRIIQVSDSRIVSETENSMIIEDDSAQKLFQLKNNIGLAFCGIQRYGTMTIEKALECFKTAENLNLPPVQLADKLRDHLAEYWGNIGKGVFCFHLCGYYQGRPFNIRRFNPLPPAHLINEAHNPAPPFTLFINGADDESIARALSGLRAPHFTRIPAVDTLNHLIDITFLVIDRVPCCGGDAQVQIITPNGVADFKSVRKPPLRVVHGMIREGTYGLKVSGDGEIYSSTIRTGEETDKTYVAMVPPNYLQVWSEVGGISKKQLEIAAHPGGGGGGIDFYRDDNFAGTIQVDSSGFFISAIGSNLKLSAANVIVTDNLVPDTHLTGQIGTAIAVWDYVRAANIVSADLCFKEEVCPVCEQPFIKGDIIVLLVKAVQPGHMTATIPIHDRCKDTSKTLTFEVQETETRYRLDDSGEVIAYSVPAYIEEDIEVIRLKEGYSLDEITGQFRKKAFVTDVAREGYSARFKSIYDDAGRLLPPAKREVVFCDELTGREVELSSILKPVEVFPERPATKDEAVEVVTVRRRRPVMKTVTVEVGGVAGAESPTTETSAEASAEPDPNPA